MITITKIDEPETLAKFTHREQLYKLSEKAWDGRLFLDAENNLFLGAFRFGVHMGGENLTLIHLPPDGTATIYRDNNTDMPRWPLRYAPSNIVVTITNKEDKS